MAKFSKIQQGAAGYRVIDFEMPGGVVEKVRVVPLIGARDDEVHDGARAFAEAHGGKGVVGDVEFDRGVYLYTILLACQDHESPLDKPEPFFESLDVILNPLGGLDRDRIAYLFEVQMQVQDDYAPRPKKLTPLQYVDWLLRTAEAGDGAELPFERSPRPTQRAFVRGIAKLALASLPGRSSPGPTSPTGSTSSATTSSSSSAQPPPANAFRPRGDE